MKEIDLQKDFHHCLLFYSDKKRDLKKIEPYVARFFPDSHEGEWLFDAYLFLHLLNTSGVYADHDKATAADWQHTLDIYLSSGHEVDLLDKSVGELEKRLGAAPTKRKVILTIPYPHPNTKNFGDIDGDGQEEDLSTREGRRRVVKWYVHEAIRRFREADFHHVELWGFYWVNESIEDTDDDLLSDTSDIIHQAGCRFLFIPHYMATNLEKANQYFDVVTLQPNYSFNAWTTGGEARSDRLYNTYERCNKWNFGIEMELRSNTLYDFAIFQRYLAYGSSEYLGYQNSVNTYFLGTGLYSNDGGPNSRRIALMYHMLCNYVTGLPVPDPDVFVTNFEMHDNTIRLLSSTNQRISSVDLLIDTEKMPHWRGVIVAETEDAWEVSPAGWAICATEIGERYQTFSIPVAMSADILSLRFETWSDVLVKEAIVGIHFDCQGCSTFVNYCLYKPYTLLPDLMERPYNDNQEGNSLVGRDIDTQRVGWFHSPVHIILDLGESRFADTLEVYSLKGYGGVEPAEQITALFSDSIPAQKVSSGVGALPTHLRYQVLDKAEDTDSTAYYSTIQCAKAKVENIPTRFISLLLRPAEMRWLILTQIRVKNGKELVPIQKYTLIDRPAGQLGNILYDNGRQLTDGTEASAYDSAVILWDAEQGNKTVTVDLEEVQPLHCLSLHTLSCPSRQCQVPRAVSFRVSPDGREWHCLPTTGYYSFNVNEVGDVVFQAHLMKEISARYVRAEIEPSGGKCGISEITAY